MPQPFSVNPEDIARSMKEMKEFLAFSESTLSRLDTLVNQLHINWQGESAEAHKKAHETWKHGSALMKFGVESLRRAGKTARTNYREAMEKNTNMWA